MELLDALIIGGGPAGATTAFLLAEAGWSVGLVEKKTFPRKKVCGEFISASSAPLLHKLGLRDYYETNGGPEIRRVGLYAGSMELTADMPSLTAAAKWGRALGREHLDTVLLNKARAAGAHIWQPAEAKRIRTSGKEFLCSIRESHNTFEIPARVLIMANGSWEKPIVKHESQIHTSSDLLAFKAHFINTRLPTDLMPLLAFPGGYGGMVHSDAQRTTLSCCIQRKALQSLRHSQPGMQAADTVFSYIKTHCKAVHDVLSHAEREGRGLAAGPIQPGIRHCYKNGVFFVGNSAGEAHPIVAEGISMAMQSAWLLTSVLIDNKRDILIGGKERDAAGAYYTKVWRNHFAKRIHAAAFFAQLAILQPWTNLLLSPLIKCFPGLLTLGARLSGKIRQMDKLKE